MFNRQNETSIKKLKYHLLDLIELESQRRFIFHGSGKFHHQLEPCQAYTFVDGQSKKDGEPAVFASELADYAIFMALIDVNWISGCRASCSYQNGRLIFGASQLTIDQFTGSTVGFVHVLEKSKFAHRGGIEWLCTSIVRPTSIIEVRVDDFQRTINILPEP